MRLFIQAVLLALFTIFMIVEPSVSMGAAHKGLTLWWQTVVPALLPFFIVSELLIRLQIIRYIGKWLTPLMQPLFNLPGAAGLAIAMGFTSGFPVGAVVTSRLWQENLITRRQASHLIAFTNNSSPLFIIGAIGVGMLHHQIYGYILAAAHYGSNLLVGWYLGRKNRAYGPDDTSIMVIESPSGNLLGASIRSSIINICQIGGFIIFFMVFSAFLARIGIIDVIVDLALWLFPGLPPSLAYSSTIGLLEITQGAGAVSAAQAPILWKLLAISTLLAFSGLCIQAQIHSLIVEPGISFRPYMAARLLQIPPALVLTWAGYHLLTPVPVFAGTVTASTAGYFAPWYWEWLGLLLVMLVLSGAINVSIYVFAGLTHRGPREWSVTPHAKPAPGKLINHQHTGWHHLRSLRLRFWPW